jgi:hypothetical protein
MKPSRKLLFSGLSITETGIIKGFNSFIFLGLPIDIFSSSFFSGVSVK